MAESTAPTTPEQNPAVKAPIARVIDVKDAITRSGREPKRPEVGTVSVDPTDFGG